ncbi:TIGR03619 family F420-dependent LLM class oxidoreductase [Allostreptomyces psammosilenae]|uniref:Putative F420-dependent oxidoreductase n=1 Tax=Allostreptomyces psammosilenae TaxID=1892865 RepID=A0A853A1P7_9ACTN|nr:TIGR03619 family F420-dependent LLM class oxidoreductase [Allostreptomyces psammosilenae]NYI06834.1 putative F420-dependent oxidoreductase [Allostreptomyces psammosilenae]
MRYDIVLPDESAQDDPRRVVELARLAEELGFGGVWLPDHLIPPRGFGGGYGGVHEPLVTLAAIAAVTSRVRLGTSVVVLPLRDPFLVAKQTATLEALAPGRVVLGVGAGWERSEFEALGVPFRERGRRTDAALRLIRHLHTVGRGPYRDPVDDRLSFEAGVLEPLPARPVPIMVGGTSEAALRRAAAHGDVWQAVGLGPDQFVEHRRRLEALGSRPVAAGARIAWEGPERDRPLEELRGELAAWEEAGPEHLALWLGPLEGFATRMRLLAALRDRR